MNVRALFGKLEPVTAAFLVVALGAYFVAFKLGADELAKFLLAALLIAIAAVCRSLFGRAPGDKP